MPGRNTNTIEIEKKCMKIIIGKFFGEFQAMQWMNSNKYKHKCQAEIQTQNKYK